MRKLVTLAAKHSLPSGNRILHFCSLTIEAGTHITLGRYTDNILLSDALTSAVSSCSIALGSQVHGQLLKLGFSGDVFSCNNLIRMYSKLGCLGWGLKVFDEMPDRNVVSWTLIISGAAQHGHFDLGMKAFSGMVRGGVRPNEFSFGSVMKLCTGRLSGAGFGIHCFTVKLGLKDNPFVCSSTINFYAKIGDLGSAEQLFFPSLKFLGAGCWNAMIEAYAQCGCNTEATRVLSLMRRFSVSMDEYTYISGLKGCAVTGDLQAGKVIHGLIIQGEFEHSTDVMNALVDMYFKLGESHSALKLFEKIINKDVISWNSVFAGVCQDDSDAHDLRKLFNSFLSSGLRPSRITFTILLKQCAKLHDLNFGLRLYYLSIQLGFSDDASVAGSLIDFFCRCDATQMARAVFDGTASRHASVWNAMIRGYTSNHCSLQALELFNKARQLSIEANEFTFATIFEASCGSENSQTGQQIHGVLIKSGFAAHGFVYSSLLKTWSRADLLASFSQILRDLDPLDLPCWSTMMSTLVRHGCYSEVIEVLRSLLDGGKKPDEFVFGSVLNSFASMAAGRHHTDCAHSLVLKTGFQLHPFVASALIDAYAKCGSVDSAQSVFIDSLHHGDSVLFNSMITGYAHHGLVNKALETFELMKLANLRPSLPTFVSVISACGHLGHVSRGLDVFQSINSEHGLEPSPDVFGCVVDMLSRYGFLEDAKSVIEAMPFPAWPAILRTLLSGCRIHGDNVGLGVWAAEKLRQLGNKDGDSAPGYVLLSRVYSEGSRWQDAAEVDQKMASRGVRKDPAYSRIGV
uniref:Pentatricopeptide repeat-containing protein n=1 Tax=Kalanchoe fedtschenkoi TaxID=63787 RepID=A0A7N0U6K8_KALFE